MFNPINPNGATVTEKLGLDSEIRELKFGSSFTSSGGRNKGQQGGFHTIRYDFKPASVDPSKVGTLEVGPSGQVTISMPHYDNKGSTTFIGSTRPHSKECVLIIDKETGEVTLEKLSHNVQVKKTRQEGGSKGSGSSKNQVPSAVAPPTLSVTESRTTSSSASTSSRNEPKVPPSREENNKRQLLTTSSSSGRIQNSHSPLVSSRHSPVPFSNISSGAEYRSPSNFDKTNSFDSIPSKQSHGMPSLTSIEDLLITPPPTVPVPAPVAPKHSHSNTNLSAVKKHSKDASTMSDSSSDSSSSSSSGEEEDDSSSVSDMEEVIIPNVVTTSSAPMNRSDNNANRPPIANISMPTFNLEASNTKPAVLSSMPSHLLCEDLQLSESGSESD